MTKREHAEAWVQHLLDAATHGASLTDNALDDSVVVRLHQAWEIPFVKDFLIDRILAVVGGDETEAIASPELTEQLNALNLGFGDLAKFISVAVQLFKLLKDSGILGK